MTAINERGGWRPAFPGQIPGSAAGSPMPPTDLRAGDAPAPTVKVEQVTVELPPVHFPELRLEPGVAGLNNNNGCLPTFIANILNKGESSQG